MKRAALGRLLTLGAGEHVALVEASLGAVAPFKSVHRLLPDAAPNAQAFYYFLVQRVPIDVIINMASPSSQDVEASPSEELAKAIALRMVGPFP